MRKNRANIRRWRNRRRRLRLLAQSARIPLASKNFQSEKSRKTRKRNWKLFNLAQRSSLRLIKLIGFKCFSVLAENRVRLLNKFSFGYFSN